MADAIARRNERTESVPLSGWLFAASIYRGIGEMCEIALSQMGLTLPVTFPGSSLTPIPTGRRLFTVLQVALRNARRGR